ncbi:uncharacterized protein N7482_007072 [Penicillium canariense]|uniref:Zn(2)-C6 fungal-type domain-containing protein n=1 Tax=Penicillium canariense TaxID=189055 RepID=A0A9W9LJZ0_9EURO|nr:uncharacterized protein N7482_007072 [Penicillium canariense]KAJ5160068.1 hypothetical protein N7482_007072 [Penicillium canariense]
MLNHAAESIGNRRSACDRCRRHKLRCEKGDTARCRRCEKADAQCVMGPALKSGRPTQILNDPQQQVFFAPREHSILGFPADAVPDASMLQPIYLDTPSDVPSIGAGPEMHRLMSPANIDDFNDIWSPSFGQGLFPVTVHEQVPVTPPSEPRNEVLEKLAGLQANILADLEAVKHCRTADKCPEAVNPTDSITGQNAMVGRMLDHSTALLDVLNCFQPICADADVFELSCEIPTMTMLLSCYVCLVRIYRTIFSCILDSLPFLLGVQHPIPQLFPGMHLGGFKLEARVDLQVQILVRVSEGMLKNIETRFGLPGSGSATGEETSRLGKAARLLQIMLEEEASEQPQLYNPRGHCQPLKEILASLRDMDHECQA